MVQVGVVGHAAAWHHFAPLFQCLFGVEHACFIAGFDGDCTWSYFHAITFRHHVRIGANDHFRLCYFAYSLGINSLLWLWQQRLHSLYSSSLPFREGVGVGSLTQYSFHIIIHIRPFGVRCFLPCYDTAFHLFWASEWRISTRDTNRLPTFHLPVFTLHLHQEESLWTRSLTDGIAFESQLKCSAAIGHEWLKIFRRCNAVIAGLQFCLQNLVAFRVDRVE